MRWQNVRTHPAGEQEACLSPKQPALTLVEFAFIIAVVETASVGALLAMSVSAGEAIGAIVAHLG